MSPAGPIAVNLLSLSSLLSPELLISWWGSFWNDSRDVFIGSRWGVDYLPLFIHASWIIPQKYFEIVSQTNTPSLFCCDYKYLTNDTLLTEPHQASWREMLHDYRFPVFLSDFWNVTLKEQIKQLSPHCVTMLYTSHCKRQNILWIFREREAMRNLHLSSLSLQPLSPSS